MTDESKVAGLSLPALGSPVHFERTRTLDTPDALKAIQEKLHPKGEAKGETKSESKLHSSGEQFGGTRKGGKQFNEDSFFYFTSATGRCYVGGIYDGHGGYNGARWN